MTTLIYDDKFLPLEDLVPVTGNCQFTFIECKTFDAAVDWGKLKTVLECPVSFGKTDAFLCFLKILRATIRGANLREFLRVLEKAKVVKTKVSLHYIQLVAMRPVLRLQALLRQKLANSAPVAHLVLRNRVRYICVTHPAVAPPKSA